MLVVGSLAGLGLGVVAFVLIGLVQFLFVWLLFVFYVAVWGSVVVEWLTSLCCALWMVWVAI